MNNSYHKWTSFDKWHPFLVIYKSLGECRTTIIRFKEKIINKTSETDKLFSLDRIFYFYVLLQK